MKKIKLISIILVLALLGSVLAGCGSKGAVSSNADPEASDGLTYPDDSDISQADSGSSSADDAAVATCGSLTMNNQLLNYYYWLIFASYYSNYSSYISTDTSLSEQYVYDGYSWKDFFVSNAINAWTSIAYYLQEAKADGYVLTGDYADTMSGFKDNITQKAQSAGYTNVDEYLQKSYGEGADYDSYYNFYNDYYTALGYREAKLADYESTHTGETINDVNVRHILIKPENTDDSASWQAALDKANEIYADWQTVGTEDYFSQLATQYSEDTGSTENGGLYENVYPGQMVTNFNDWCFDSSRKSGDSAVISSDYGYHIMYFVGTSDEVYTDYPSYLAQKDLTEYESGLSDKYPSQSFTDKAVIYEDFGQS